MDNKIHVWNHQPVRQADVQTKQWSFDDILVHRVHQTKISQCFYPPIVSNLPVKITVDWGKHLGSWTILYHIVCYVPSHPIVSPDLVTAGWARHLIKFNFQVTTDDVDKLSPTSFSWRKQQNISSIFYISLFCLRICKIYVKIGEYIYIYIIQFSYR